MEIINKANLFLLTKEGKWITIFTILVVNSVLYNAVGSLGFPSSIQSRKDATGLSIEVGRHFTYFYYYLNIYPLSTLNNNLEYSKSAAQQEIETNGENLIMEYNHWSRFGESCRIWAFLPNAYLDGSIKNPSVRLFSSILFTISLILLFIGFRKIAFPAIGMILVSMINFTPYFVYEVYANENIFSLLASTFFITLGLTLPTLFKTDLNRYKQYTVFILLSIFIALISEIRNEASIVWGSLFLIIVLSNCSNILQKTLVILVCFGSFIGCKKVIEIHFNNKFKQAYEIVKNNNGHLYTGARTKGHTLWHPIFCGLGDYDTKYGYEWKDTVAYKYGIPIVNEKYNLDIEYSNGYTTNNYYDEEKLYYIKPEEIIEYEQVLKEKVLNDIKNDPFWYIEILLKRTAKILTITIPIPYVGWSLVPLIFYLIKKRKWSYVKLIFVSLPLSLSSFLIYAGNGSSYSSIYVYLIITVLLFLWREKNMPSKAKIFFP